MIYYSLSGAPTLPGDAGWETGADADPSHKSSSSSQGPPGPPNGSLTVLGELAVLKPSPKQQQQG